MEARKEGAALTLEEDRETGAVAWSTYRFWLTNMGSVWLVIMLLAGYIVSACAGVSITLWLGFWQRSEFDSLSSGAYQGIYAGAFGFYFLVCRVGQQNSALPSPCHARDELTQQLWQSQPLSLR